MCTMTMTKPGSRKMSMPSERPMPRPIELRRHRDDGLSSAQRRRVKRVRAALRSGEYENALKLEVTVDRLLDVLNSAT
jgi:hypothetical protein